MANLASLVVSLEANIARLGKSAYGAYLRRIANEPGVPGKAAGKV